MSPSQQKRVASSPPATAAVMIATYRRPQEIRRCLIALEAQRALPDDVIVVARHDDEETKAVLSHLTSLRVIFRLVMVYVPGVVAARNAGLDACTSDIVAIIDDDTAPHPDWLQRILDDFRADPTMGGLGGRDRCFDGVVFDDRQASVVGKLQWFGRVIGNHHLGFGEIREVDVLKGANMSFRMSAIGPARFDGRLKGVGTQPNEDKAFSIAVKRAGWSIKYDPAVIVDHFPGFRPDARQYVGVSRIRNVAHFQSFAYNEVVSVWDALSPLRRFAFVVWSFVVGTATCPGLIQAIRFTPVLGGHSWQRFWLAQTAKVLAYRDLLWPSPTVPPHI